MVLLSVQFKTWDDDGKKILISMVGGSNCDETITVGLTLTMQEAAEDEQDCGNDKIPQ